MSVVDALKETIGDVSSVSPSSERMRGLWVQRASAHCLLHGVYYPHQHSIDTPVCILRFPRWFQDILNFRTMIWYSRRTIKSSSSSTVRTLAPRKSPWFPPNATEMKAPNQSSSQASATAFPTQITARTSVHLIPKWRPLGKVLGRINMRASIKGQYN